MKLRALIFICFVWLSSSCELLSTEAQDAACIIPATVRDITGLDGCSFILELNNGERLVPLMESSPAASGSLSLKVNGNYFTLIEGQKVLINYVEEYRPNICMAGQSVIISCIQVLKNQ
ncbi:MAG TPA: hypothetical protein PKC24_01985 [Cyclobacteriaceae bacterium]|nr:hypothetical protein [Cyclobacteriaceae bacterium]